MQTVTEARLMEAAARQINIFLRLMPEGIQSELHNWGIANSVRLDAGKESHHILHQARGHGNGFILLGLVCDCSLRMSKCISILARAACWRLYSVLRP